MLTAIIITAIIINSKVLVIDSSYEPTTDPASIPSYQPTSNPTCHDNPGRSYVCPRLIGDNRPMIDVVMLVDTDGVYLNANGKSRLNQCNYQQICIRDTLSLIKGEELVETGQYPASRLAYIEFDKNDVTEILSLSDTDLNGQGNDVTRCEIEGFYGMIDERCDEIYDSSDGNECDDNEPTKLYQALEYVQNNVFTDFSMDRERYIIIFNNCQLPQTEINDICTEFEDYVINNNINIMMINEGSDGFSENGDDYISCLVQNDPELIYTSNRRNIGEFHLYGLGPIIAPTICHVNGEVVMNPNNHGFSRRWRSFDENGMDMMVSIFIVFMLLIFVLNVTICYRNRYYNGLYQNAQNDEIYDPEKSAMINDNGYKD